MRSTHPTAIVQRFRGGLAFQAHRLVCHSTLVLGVIKKRKRRCESWDAATSCEPGGTRYELGAVTDSGLVGSTALGGVPREQKMLKGHLPRVTYHKMYYSTEKTRRPISAHRREMLIQLVQHTRPGE